MGQDDLRIKEYIIKRLHIGDILKITDSIIREFSPYEISLLSNTQPTSSDVERSVQNSIKWHTQTGNSLKNHGESI